MSTIFKRTTPTNTRRTKKKKYRISFSKNLQILTRGEVNTCTKKAKKMKWVTKSFSNTCELHENPVRVLTYMWAQILNSPNGLRMDRKHQWQHSNKSVQIRNEKGYAKNSANLEAKFAIIAGKKSGAPIDQRTVVNYWMAIAVDWICVCVEQTQQ